METRKTRAKGRSRGIDFIAMTGKEIMAGLGWAGIEREYAIYY
jgi:hypothetical protein